MDMEPQAPTPQTILLSLLEEHSISRSNLDQPSLCLLCKSPWTLNTGPIAKFANHKLRDSYTQSLCQLFGLQQQWIAENLREALFNAAYCENCFQLIFDIDFLSKGIKGYQRKLISLKHEAERLLFNSGIKKDEEEVFYGYSESDVLEEAFSTTTIIKPNSLKSAPITSSRITKSGKTSSRVYDQLKETEVPEVEEELKPTFTRSGRRVSKPKEFFTQVQSSDSETGDGYDDKEEFVENDYILDSSTPDAEINGIIQEKNLQAGQEDEVKKYQSKHKGKTYSCNQCPQTFRKSSRLETHIQRDHLKAEPKLKCVLCQGLYYDDENLKRHYRERHSAKDLENCQLIHDIPPGILNFLQKRAAPYLPVPEPIQKRSRKGIPLAKIKKKAINRRRVKGPCSCELCGKTFPAQQNLTIHMKYRHVENLKKPYCHICGKLFNTAEQLHEHEQLHKSVTHPWTCVICPAEDIQLYQRKSQLQKHVISTHEENAFRCPECPKAVLTKARLYIHIRKDHKVKGHFCKICGHREPYPNLLADHYLIKHTTEEPFKCEVEGCSGVKFKTKNQFCQHNRKYHSPKPNPNDNNQKFTCNICSKSFKSYFWLEEHAVLHLDLRPFICEICSAGFKTIGSLKEHLEVHEKHEKEGKGSEGYKFKVRKGRLPEGQIVPEEFPSAPRLGWRNRNFE